MAHLRACSTMERAQRLECLDKLSRDIPRPPDRSVRGGDNWIISETTSPVNYTPVATRHRAFSQWFRWHLDATLHSLPAVVALNWWSQDRRSPAAAPITPYPTASMTVHRYSLQRLAIVWNWCCVHRRCHTPAAIAPREGHIAIRIFKPIGCRPRRTFLARRTEDGAGEAGRGVQMAARRCRATQLMVIDDGEMNDDRD